MFAKIQNHQFIPAPSVLYGNNTIVYNPPAEMYAAQGWKPVVLTEPPSDPPEGYTYESAWKEHDDEIVQTWALVELPDDIDDAEAFDIIFGGDGE